MEQNCYAVYENGVLRPVTLLFDLKEGQKLHVTVRPVVELDPAEYARRQAEVERQLEAEGILERTPVPVDGPPPENYQPPVIEGETLAETIIKNRR